MTITNFAHPSDGTLRAMADRQLPLARRLATAIHLARCRRCRDALEAIRHDARRANHLLGMLDGTVDTETAWRRIGARHPELLRRERTILTSGSSRLAWAVASAFALATVMLAADRLRGRSPVMAGGTGHQDICCWDLDGGGRSDDGVMTRSSPGELLDCVVLYDDLDRSRSFTPGDAVRYVSRPESCVPFTPRLDAVPHPDGFAMLMRGR